MMSHRMILWSAIVDPGAMPWYFVVGTWGMDIGSQCTLKLGMREVFSATVKRKSTKLVTKQTDSFHTYK